MSSWREAAKEALGRLPWTAELYQRWGAEGAVPAGGFSLERLASHIPGWVEAVREAQRADSQARPRRVLTFGYLQWWLEYALAMALLLRAEGHQVDLAYLPHRRWHADPHDFDLRRQWTYLGQRLAPLADVIGLLPLASGDGQLPPALARAMDIQSQLDVQYSLAKEEIDWGGDGEVDALLALRQARNRSASAAAMRILRAGAYDAVVIPNGSILEFGALYRTAQHLGVQVVTYEFGEQRQRMWLAQDDEVMRLPTDELWKQRGNRALGDAQVERLRTLYAARRGGRRWSQFARQWQRSESEGAQAARTRLGLSMEKPVVLLCTNVVGDSLALDRQVFTHGMADWLADTVRHFMDRPEVQLVVRVHPGEMLGAGHPSVEIVRGAVPDLPPQVVVIPPESEINTYDLIELAHLGLVYTTTVGLEMAMFGVPVVVSGATHFRGKGFTYDPDSMEAYLAQIDRLLEEPPGWTLPPQQIELAWRYAYLFFFEFPFAFPWHLLSFWEDLEVRPLEEMVSLDCRASYARTLAALAGEPIEWLHEPAGEQVQVGA